MGGQGIGNPDPLEPSVPPIPGLCAGCQYFIKTFERRPGVPKPKSPNRVQTKTELENLSVGFKTNCKLWFWGESISRVSPGDDRGLLAWSVLHGVALLIVGLR
jgi:hypothetical protein